MRRDGLPRVITRAGPGTGVIVAAGSAVDEGAVVADANGTEAVAEALGDAEALARVAAADDVGSGVVLEPQAHNPATRASKIAAAAQRAFHPPGTPVSLHPIHHDEGHLPRPVPLRRIGAPLLSAQIADAAHVHHPIGAAR